MNRKRLCAALLSGILIISGIPQITWAETPLAEAAVSDNSIS